MLRLMKCSLLLAILLSLSGSSAVLMGQSSPRECSVCDLYAEKCNSTGPVSTTGTVSFYEEYSEMEFKTVFRLYVGDCFIDIKSRNHLGLRDGVMARVVGEQRRTVDDEGWPLEYYIEAQTARVVH